MKTKWSTGNEGWILDEDRALRDLLDNMYVSDDKVAKRRVGVWFGHPDKEVRDQRYPYCTIDLIDVNEELDRAHRGMRNDPLDSVFSSGLDYGDRIVPNGVVGYRYHYPIPIRLTYQVTSWARNPRHDRQIMQNLMQRGITPMQGGSINVSDNTVRRLDFLAFNKRDSVEDDRRLLSNVFILAMSSEVPWKQFEFVREAINVRLRFTANQGNQTVEVDETEIK